MKDHQLSDIWMLLFSTWFVALAATLSVLFIGEVMGQEPCVLCWYQRAFMFPLAVILGIAAWRGDPGVWLYALPLSVFGAGIAGYHSLLFYKLIPEPIKPCSDTGPSCSGDEMIIFGSLPLPLLSLATFILIAVLLLAVRRKSTI